MTTQSLYEISMNFESLIEMREDFLDDPEELAEIEKGLEITQQDFKEKSLNYAKYIRSEDASIEGIDSEIKRLTAMKKSKENKINFLKGRLSDAMKLFGIDKFDLGIFKLSFRKSESVEIIGEVIPDEYSRIIPESKAPDKNLIKDAIKLGVVLDFAIMKTNFSLQIK